jgi:hypothetical protein
MPFLTLYPGSHGYFSSDILPKATDVGTAIKKQRHWDLNYISNLGLQRYWSRGTLYFPQKSENLTCSTLQKKIISRIKLKIRKIKGTSNL